MDDHDGYPPKQQVLNRIPKRIKELQFGVLTNHEIVKQSVVEISDRNLYQEVVVSGAPREITPHGPLDHRLGTSSKSGICAQCKEDLKHCNGHFGHVKLVLPAYHIGYFRKIIDTLSIICKECSRLLLDEKTRRKYLKTIRRPDLDTLRKEAVCKKISDEAKKCRKCPHCAAVNGSVRKVPHNPIKLIHNKYQGYLSSTAKSKQKPESMEQFEKSFDIIKKESPDLEKHIKRAVEDMDPLRALNLFRRMLSSDIELIGMDPTKAGPEVFLWQYVPAPPVAIRPSVAQENASTDDDITNKLGDIVELNNFLKAGLKAGQPISQIIVIWEYLQIQLAMYIDGNLPGLGRDSTTYSRPLRGFNQRLKGKQGRFRGNLSGKRVDFSARTVISPDPNLSIEEVAVPSRIAKNMTYPERVTRYNHEKLRACIRRGKLVHPGANYIIKTNGRKIVLEVLGKHGKLGNAADELEIGDVVERHLDDGDIVLFNRQPSLHKLSILSHRVKVRPWRTFRLNECVCNPYNADFDGDEMNLHVPQTEEARTEAIALMGVKHNLTTPKNGAPIIAAIQDFVTCAYLSSSKDLFFDRQTFANVCTWMFNGDSVIHPETGEHLPIQLPPPTVLKPAALWTGKQVWNVLIRPNQKIKVLLNLEAKCKEYKAPTIGLAPDMSIDDAFLVIRNSQVMCGVMDKNTVGDGKKDSVFYVMMRDFGPDHAVAAMNRLARLSSRWLTNQGFSLGIGDVYPSHALTAKKLALIKDAEDRCLQLIEMFNKGNLERDSGCDEEMTMENGISGILNKVREAAGEACFAELSRRTAPLVMAKCGSKGSTINVAQMIATVGQQIIGGTRVLNGFQDRTLPHFAKGSREASAKGFVGNSFFTGLTPTEFIFHAMSGREGLVDTAVKTAETGYMSRRLMKSLEDLSVQYDHTVRNSSSQIVQFQFGDDKLDPVDMEGNAQPVNFDRTFMHAMTSAWNDDESGLTPQEIYTTADRYLQPHRDKLQRLTLLEEKLEYDDQSIQGVDQYESARNFLGSVESYIDKKAHKITALQQRVSETRTTRHGHKVTSFEYADKVLKLSASTLKVFLDLCLSKYQQSQVEPGHAVGAVGAQSIGEPGTQMTLKTFHFAGVAGMSITQGVPRIKEIINASKKISTPVITCSLDSQDVIAGRVAKALIEKTYLGDIVQYIEEAWSSHTSYIFLKIDWSTISKLGLQVTRDTICHAIRDYKPFKAWNLSTKNISSHKIRIHARYDSIAAEKSRSKTKSKTKGGLFGIYQNIRRLLPGIVVKGYPLATRAIIKKSDRADKNGQETVSVFVEGYGLKECMTTDGVDGYHTKTNSVMECKDVLGIEAARKTIIHEIAAVMSGMSIDPRHMQLLADVMTFRGEVLGITRFGLAKMRDSVLQLASFEKTPDHLFAAASGMKSDKIEGVSECIIMGQSMNVGTGAMKVFRRLAIAEEDVKKRTSAFESAWEASESGRPDKVGKKTRT